MKEKSMSITEARAQLLALSKTARRRMARVVMTNKGEAESVLMGINDYRSLLATVELSQRPDIMSSIRDAISDIRDGRTMTMEEAHGVLRKVGEQTTKAVEIE